MSYRAPDYKSEEDLAERLDRMVHDHRRNQKIKPVLCIICVLLLIFVEAAIYLTDARLLLHPSARTLPVTETLNYRLFDAIMVFVLLICMATVINWMLLHRPTQEEIADARDRLDLLRCKDEGDRAEKLFKLYQKDLRRYYNEALNQFQKLFWVGVLCLIFGFVIAYGTYQLVRHASDTTEKMPVAILGAVATLLGNFVGAIYVKMYAESTKSLTAFHNRLVGTHHMHYGAYLATRIVDEPELLNETWSKMAIGTVPKGPDAAEKPEQKGEGVSGPAAESDSLAKFLEKVLERISEKRGKEDT